jgi:nicotinate phosphoribosyltransferase
VGGRKYALRRRDRNGVAEAEVVGIGEAPEDDGDDRSLLVHLVRDGEVVGAEDLDAARQRHVRARAELPVTAQHLSQGDPVIPTRFLEPKGPRDGDAHL